MKKACYSIESGGKRIDVLIDTFLIMINLLPQLVCQFCLFGTYNFFPPEEFSKLSASAIE